MAFCNCRRCMMKKRRCTLITFSVVFFMLCAYSWRQTQWLHDKDTPTEAPEFEESSDAIRKETPAKPEFIVLEQPQPVPNINVNSEDEVNSQKIASVLQKDEKIAAESKKDEQSGQEPKGDQPAKNQTELAYPQNSQKEDAVIDIKLYSNKTDSSIDLVKNKTLSQMGVIGEKDTEKRIPKIMYVKSKWQLAVSFEDIGNIMKDTSFLNKLKPLNLSGPMLMSTRNRTSNFSLSMPLKMGYCDCWERYCYCCVQLVNKQLHLNNKTCANFTFVSKEHELAIDFSIDGKPTYTGSLSADATPLLCLGSIPSVSDICLHFFNMTYKVDRLGLHKSQLLGCTDITLNIYNKTISVFPMDCFQIPGDPNHHKKDEHVILPNFVP